jgi:hypothetical protein
VRLIVQFFKWATSEELVPAGVWQGLRSVPGLRKGRSEARDHEPVEPVPEAHVETILPYHPPVVAAMVRIQGLCGMRPQEVIRMRACDLTTTGAV